ncbi:MAG: alpha/beta hydrolase [Hyphomicrobiales bacterium]
MSVKFFFFLFLAVLIAFIAIVMINPTAKTKAMSLASQLIAKKNISVKNNISYGPLNRQNLDHYQPKTGSTQKPILIFYYGGGWKSGEKSIYHFIGAELASKGFDVIIPDYRLFPEVKFPKFINDAALAYNWVWQNLAKKDERPIILIGHSAGAHIAALMAYDQSYLNKFNSAANPKFKPAGFIGFAGPYAFNPVTWPTTKDIFSTIENEDLARPVAFVNSKSPASLLFHGEEDTVVKKWNMETLTKALKDNKIKVEANLLPGISHIDIMLNIGLPLKQQNNILEKLMEFIKAVEENTI